MKVEQLLVRKGTRIISVRMDETIETAARMLRRENIGAVVVKDVCGSEGDTIVGMFSERDFLRVVVDGGPQALKRPVSSVMSRPVVSCGPRDSLDDVIELFNQYHIRHVPVIDRDALIGIVSIRDVVAARAEATNVEALPRRREPVLERSVA